jgi:hypothetical protein
LADPWIGRGASVLPEASVRARWSPEVGRGAGTVLVALAVDAGRPVPTETLIDRAWDDDPPAGARAGLYSYLTRFRLAQAEAGGERVRIVSRAGGYLLDLEPDRVDALRFGRLIDQAREKIDGAGRARLLRQPSTYGGGLRWPAWTGAGCPSCASTWSSAGCPRCSP